MWNSSPATAQPVARPLSESSVRAIIRENVELISALIDTAPRLDWSDWEFSDLASRVLIGEPKLLDSMIAYGFGMSHQAAASLNLLVKARALKEIFQVTAGTINGATIARIAAEELAGTCLSLSGTRH